MRIGVAAIKIEGRQRSPAYVAEVTRVWREAIDECARNRSRFSVSSGWTGVLARVSEGQQHTLGAYHRRWK
jgi:putative protease